MRKVTVWLRDGEFNHIENGHCQNAEPTPKAPEHKKLWANGKWEAVLTYMTDSICPVVDYP